MTAAPKDLMAALRDSIDQARATRTTAATVTPIRREARPGYLPYRWATDGRTYEHGIHRRMAQIEDQAVLVYQAADGDVAEAHALLAAAGCRFTAEQVERLFELSVAAGELQNGLGGREFFYAADDYADYLHHLARVATESVTA